MVSPGDPNPRPRILVAEDDRSLRRLLELRLLVDGYEVMTVEDGGHALSLIDRWHPSVVVCDVMMPNVSGLTVCRQLRSCTRTAGLPIVLLTARCFDEDIESVMSLGHITFLNKPFRAQELQAMLHELLDSHTSADTVH